MVTSDQGSSNTAEAPRAPVGKSPDLERIAGWPGIPGPPFGPNFYLSLLPDRVISQCQGRPGNLPVVNLHLADGRTLDLCHIAHLAERWLAVQYFRDPGTCEDMELPFLPYELVVLVTLSVHAPDKRRIGFKIQPGAPSWSGHPAESAPSVNPARDPPGQEDES